MTDHGSRHSSVMPALQIEQAGGRTRLWFKNHVFRDLDESEDSGGDQPVERGKALDRFMAKSVSPIEQRSDRQRNAEQRFSPEQSPKQFDKIISNA